LGTVEISRLLISITTYKKWCLRTLGSIKMICVQPRLYGLTEPSDIFVNAVCCAPDWQSYSHQLGPGLVSFFNHFP